MAGRPGRSMPPPAAAARKAKATPARAAKPTVLGRVCARPGVIVAGATFAAVMTGIVANALILQKGHHPSPLFSPAVVEAPASVPVPPPAPRQALEQPAPAPAADPVPTEAPSAEPTPAPAAPVAHAAKKAPAHATAAHAPAPTHKATAAPAHKAAPVTHKDPIAQLLGKAQ